MKRIFILTIVVLILIQCNNSNDPESAQVPETVDKDTFAKYNQLEIGQRFYTENCAACHSRSPGFYTRDTGILARKLMAITSDSNHRFIYRPGYTRDAINSIVVYLNHARLPVAAL
jgi:hypothetical protein